jgi:serine/threonine-protein kinase
MLLSITISSLLVILSYTPNNAQEVLGFFHDNQKAPMLTYENNEFKFKISYPDNWERSVKISNEITFVSPKDKDSVSSPGGLVIKVVPLQSKNVSLGPVSNALISQLKKEHKDFKLESSQNSAIGGKSAKKIIFTATDSRLQERKALQMITINNNNIFIITYKASLNKYSTYENTINDMISSFKFTTATTK